MEVVTIDPQGRILIPKPIRERRGLHGEVELIELKDGILIRPRSRRSWDEVLGEKLKVDWGRALAVSLEGISVDDVLFS